MHSTILIIAPSREAQAALSHKLNADFHVFGAKDFPDALQVIGRQVIQVVICLSDLEPETGWELCRRLKSHPRSAHIPVVLITAEDSVPMRVRSLEAGADGHIGGPVFREHLDVQVRNLVANRTRVRRHFAREAPQGGKEMDAEEQAQLLRKLHDCLHAHVRDKDLNVDQLARLMHMSRPTLYRKIKSITPLTPNELINEARLKQAAALLASGEHRVFEVARMVGYGSQSSFGKSFLKQFKVTPATYQRMKKFMDAA